MQFHKNQDENMDIYQTYAVTCANLHRSQVLHNKIQYAMNLKKIDISLYLLFDVVDYNRVNLNSSLTLCHTSDITKV